MWRRRSSTTSGSRSRREMSGQPIRGEGEVDVGRDRIARGADGGDLLAARAGDRAEPRSSGSLALAAGDPPQPRTPGATGGARRRPGDRLPAARPPAGSGAGTGGDGGTAAGPPAALRCWRRSTLLLLRGYRALAVASGLTVLAYAIDVVAGSPLTALSLLGPEPRSRRPLLRDRQRARGAAGGAGRGGHRGRAGGLRAAGCRRAQPPSPSSPLGLLAAFVFAAGRFGADVGAAIVFPVGAGGGRRGDRRPRPAAARRLLVVAAPARRPRAAGAGRPPQRRQRPPHPLGPRRRRARRPRRRRPAPPPALRPQLRPARAARLPAPGGRSWPVWPTCGATACAPGWTGYRRCAPACSAPLAATVVGTLANDSGALAARDRHRLSPGLRRFRLGRELRKLRAKP